MASRHVNFIIDSIVNFMHDHAYLYIYYYYYQDLFFISHIRSEDITSDAK